MRKITITLFAYFLAFAAFAGPVSRKQAMEVAKSYLQTQRAARGMGQQPGTLTLAYECQPKVTRGVSTASPLYYVFNQGTQQGFVIVAGDDRVKPVLGYVDNGRFAINEVNEGVQWWLNAVEATMTSVAQVPDDGRKFEVMSDDSEFQPYVTPLVKVNWGQGAPYNNRCPLDKAHGQQSDGNYPHSLVGCTAVAMSQVLSRWQYPVHPEGKISYTTGTHKMQISEDLSTFVFDWDKMLPSYSGGKGTTAEKDAVAELCYACGVATQMNYCSQASGAFLNSSQLEEHFGIDKGCNILSRKYFTKSEWDYMAKSELSNGRPIIYFGYSMDAGHAFVCDGYNRDGLFHINWGWDGSMNGYFALAELNSAVEHAGAPTDESGSFNIDQDMIIGIQPKKAEPTVEKHQLYFNTLAIGQKNTTRNNIKVDVKYIRTDGNNFKGTMCLGVFDKNGNFVAKFSHDLNAELSGWGVYDSKTLGGVLPKSVEDGVYTLRPVCSTNSTDYIPMIGRQSSPYISYITMKVEGVKISLSNPEPYLSKFVVVENAKPLAGKAYVGATNAIEIQLRNDGALYNGPIVLQREGDGGSNTRVYANNYIVEAGEVLTIRANVKAPASGSVDKLNIWIAGDDNDIFHNNGFTYEKIGSIDYALTTPTSGTPVLKLDRCTVHNRTTYIGEPLDIDLRVSNSGGFYGNNIHAFVFPENGGTSIGSTHEKVYLDKGESADLHLSLSVDNLAPGNYFFHIYYNDANGALQLVSNNRYTFTVKGTGTISITNNENYGTVCFDYAFVMPEKIQGGIVTAAGTDNIKIDYRYQPGDIVPAHTPIIVKSERRASYNCKIVLSEEDAPAENLLSAQTDDKGYTYAGEGDFWYYRFDHDGSRHNYGFYWAEEQGEAFKLRAHTAYLAIPVNQGKTEGYPFEQAQTGIDKVLVNEGTKADEAIYTVSGVRVNGKLGSLPKGLYIVGGKKVFVK